jgi:hypothetical protein
LTIGSFSSPAPPPLEDYLRDEKDILREWLRADFGALKRARVNSN